MVLGIRCSNSDFVYAVVSGSRQAPIVLYEETIKVPKNYSKTRLLQWFIQEIEGIINKHQIKKIVIKRFEGRTRGKTYEERVELETAVYVAAGRLGVNGVFKKVRSTIAKDLGLKGRAHYLQTALDTSAIADYDGKSEREKEAIQAAWSEL